MTYDESKRQYFQGVDVKKLNDTGDLVLLCGGFGGRLRDLFLIPWNVFFSTLRKAFPSNSYRDRKYLQYKFYVRDRDDSWKIVFQGGSRPTLDVSQWQYDLVSAITAFKTHSLFPTEKENE
jgi:hypothetical protein